MLFTGGGQVIEVDELAEVNINSTAGKTNKGKVGLSFATPELLWPKPIPP